MAMMIVIAMAMLTVRAHCLRLRAPIRTPFWRRLRHSIASAAVRPFLRPPQFHRASISPLIDEVYIQWLQQKQYPSLDSTAGLVGRALKFRMRPPTQNVSSPEPLSSYSDAYYQPRQKEWYCVRAKWDDQTVDPFGPSRFYGAVVAAMLGITKH